MIKAALTYFVLVFGAGFALGVFRVLILVPRFGIRLPELLEMPVILVVIVLSARWDVRRFVVSPAAGVRLTVGFAALALPVTAELLMVVLIQGQSLGAYIASRDPVSGSVYVIMLVVFALMPLILARTRPGAGGNTQQEGSDRTI